MNWRAFRALLGREIARGSRPLRLFGLAVAVATALAFILTPDAALVPGSFAAVYGLALIFAPIGNLRSDKVQGQLEFDRVLPIGHRLVATARLIGAAVRTLPMLAGAVPLMIALERGGSDDRPTWLLAAIVSVIIWTLLTAGMWAMMAINIRWNLRRLWWLPMTIVFGPRIVISLLPPAIADVVRDTLADAVRAAAHFARTPVGAAVYLALLVLVPLAFFLGAVSLFASGLERYTFDASAAVPMRSAPPKRELGALGRGPVLAVARYCIRLATEQSRRRVLLLVIFVIVLLVGSPVLKDYARFYVRALAAMLPGGIVLQLSLARARGHLEGMQQLPHPPMVVALGHLLAVGALAVPGTAVWVLARAVTGMRPTVGNVTSLFGWIVLWSWLACVTSIWLTKRRALLLALVPGGLLLAWAAYTGFSRVAARMTAAAATFHAFRDAAGAALPLTLSCALIVVGIPLFARGLLDYQPGGTPATHRWRWLAARRAAS